MNKRQRKKRAKARFVAIDTELRKGLTPFIGPLLTLRQQAKIFHFVGSFIQTKTAQPSLTRDILQAVPLFVAPFHKWREPGTGQLTHHTGTYPYINGNGTVITKRLCDYETVDATHVLNGDVAVDCFACLAEEYIVHAPSDL